MAGKGKRAGNGADGSNQPNDGGIIGGAGDGNGLDGFVIIDPAAVDTGTGAGNSDTAGSDIGNSGSQPKRGRGRPRGSGTVNSGRKKETLAVDSLCNLLYSIHLGVSYLAKTPEFALDKEEAKLLGDATAQVLRHYNISAPAQALDWAGLISAMGTVYGPRIIAIKMKARNEKRAKENPNVVTGVPFGAG